MTRNANLIRRIQKTYKDHLKRKKSKKAFIIDILQEGNSKEDQTKGNALDSNSNTLKGSTQIKPDDSPIEEYNEIQINQEIINVETLEINANSINETISIAEAKPRVNLKGVDRDNYRYYGPLNRYKSKQGFGIQIWNNGNLFIGMFDDNKAHGYGQYTHANGDYYSGQFFKDLAAGYGIYKNSKGQMYEGIWTSDKPNVFGIEIWPDKSCYVGEYKSGEKHGLGSYRWKDESRFFGNWSRSQLNGLGLYEFNDGRIYQGFWANNKMNGYGEFFWPDGKKYCGFYKEDKKSGLGVYFWGENSKKTYIGFWTNGRQNGLGKLTNKKGEERWCMWDHGKVLIRYKTKEEAKIEFQKENLISYFRIIQLDYELLREFFLC